MVRYSRFTKTPSGAGGVAKARGERVRIQYRKTREVCHFIKGMFVEEAISYLEKVIAGDRGIPMVRHTGGCPRHGVGKVIGAPGNCVKFPIKISEKVIELLRNVLANAVESKMCTKEQLSKVRLVHVQTNRAVKSRRRCYRAHGRIAPFMQSPVHIELVAKLDDPESTEVEAAPDAERKPLSRKRVAKLRLKLANGASA